MVEIAAILSGGLATRLRPLTETIPKALVEISGKPFIDRQLTLLRSKGIRHVVLCLGYKGEVIKRFFLDYVSLSGDLTVESSEGKGARFTLSLPRGSAHEAV